MIVAGIGCRKGVSAAQIVEAVSAALSAHNLVPGDLDALATADMKRGEAAIAEAAHRFGVLLFLVTGPELRSIEERLLTRSFASWQASGSSSVSEASALAAVGRDAALLAPRLKIGPVTCAVARGNGR